MCQFSTQDIKKIKKLSPLLVNSNFYEKYQVLSYFLEISSRIQ